MHKFSIVEFLLIFSTAVNLIQTLPLALHHPGEQNWQFVPRYFVECAPPTNKASDHSSGVKNQDPTPTVEPPSNSIVLDTSTETKSDTSVQKITDALLTPTQTINEQIIEDILTDFFKLMDDSATYTNNDRFKTSKRSVDVKTSDGKLKAQNENRNWENMLSMSAEALPPSAFDAALWSRLSAIHTQMKATNFPDGFYRVSPAAVPPNSAPVYWVSPISPIRPYSGRFFGDPSHIQPQRNPFSQPFPKPFEHSYASVLIPDTKNDRKSSESDMKDGKPSEIKVSASEGSEPVFTHHSTNKPIFRELKRLEVRELPFKNLRKPESEMADRTKFNNISSVSTSLTKLTEKISTPEPGRRKSSDSYSVGPNGNEMTRSTIAGDKKKASPSIKPAVDIANLKKKLPTPAKRLDPKLIELNQLREKIRKLQAEIRASVLNKDRDHQSKLKL